MASLDEKEVDELAESICQVYLMQVDIISAVNLPKMDTFGKCDGYCMVKAIDQTYTTKTIMKEYNPQWNEKTQLCTFVDPKCLEFTVFDFDKGTQDDECGVGRLDLAGFWDEGHPGFSGSLELRGYDKAEQNKSAVNVAVKCRKLLPVWMEEQIKELGELVERQEQEQKDNGEKEKEMKDKIADLMRQNGELMEKTQSMVGEKQNEEDAIGSLKETEGELEGKKSEKEEEQKGVEEKVNEEKAEYDKIYESFLAVQKENDRLDGDYEHLNSELESVQRSIEERKREAEKEEQKQKHKEADSQVGLIEKDAAEAARIDLNRKQQTNDGCCSIL